MKQLSSQTKIIATLGPATSSKTVISDLITSGVDVFRINFSHSSKEEYLRLASLIKELNQELCTNVAILADLQGPKLRVGEIENNLIQLNEGDVITFVNEKRAGQKDHIYMSYKDFPKDVNAGEVILIDDGKIKLEVTETNKKDRVKAKVVYGGPLSSYKGVNLPGTKVSLPCLTEEDISNTVFALEHGVDWIAMSFVRKASDVPELKKLVSKSNGDAGVIAKIEKPEALLEIDQIIDAADGIMVARGDLGVEVPFDQVPLYQKQIVEKCIRKSKPVIIATQMMESMITSFRPTRAEANDVANAVLDGADTLMLSGETSIGKYPVETIKNMQQIISYTESQGNPFDKQHEPAKENSTFLADSNGIMVARGDLGVEVPFDQVPLYQKQIVEKCIRKSKPVIIATQMMESMITSFRPTRAEANDVANAVLDGADTLMLSGETSIGKYPVETIKNMQQIISYTESQGNPFDKQHEPAKENSTFLADSICFNATKLAKQVGARAIIVFTHSGYTAIRISSHRPKAQIFAFTNNKNIVQKISLVWGVIPFFLDTYNYLNEAIPEAVKILKERNLLSDGDCVVFVGTTPLKLQGSTNMMKVGYV